MSKVLVGLKHLIMVCKADVLQTLLETPEDSTPGFNYF